MKIRSLVRGTTNANKRQIVFKEAAMKRTHYSLYYLIGYLIPGGLALLLALQLALKLMFSTGEYGDVLPRFVGLLMVALGIIVSQAVRHRLEVLYPTALIVRSGMLPVMLGLYLYSGDPLFITLLVIVGFGVVLTGGSYWLDRRDKTQALK
jgi:hypothetical protein